VGEAESEAEDDGEGGAAAGDVGCYLVEGAGAGYGLDRVACGSLLLVGCVVLLVE
jgi:hypothetical protein